MDDQIRIFVADSIVTMNPSQPEAAAVAVRDGRILGVGSVEDLQRWGTATVDERFSDKVLLPGFVEAHSHASGGILWTFPYVGYFDRHDPDGTLWTGCKSIDAVIDRLQACEAELEDPNEPLLAWGVDPIYFEEDAITAADLDRVSEDRPVFVLHLNAHVGTANSALLRQSGITADTEVEGVVMDSNGTPTGELQESTALALVDNVYDRLFENQSSERGIRNYGKQARNAGCTTVADLGGPKLHDPDVLERWLQIVNDESFPARVSMAYSKNMAGADEMSHEEAAQLVSNLRAESTDKLRFGIAKLFLDGSIQGFTARLQWPHYHGDRPNGIWTLPPDELEDILRPYHDEGLTIFCHCNGDEASERFIDAVENVLRESPRWNHRHTIQHCQMATSDQYRRMSRIGLCANLFSNHLYYWGDQHYETSVGPSRAERMDACATAKRSDVPFTVHSDSPVTPLDPLHTAWCAVNRVTPSGRVLGEDERISVEEALRTITIDAAYQLKMDDEIGSIEAGKRADFAVLERNPLTADPMELREIPVWGTVLGGDSFPAAE